MGLLLSPAQPTAWLGGWGLANSLAPVCIFCCCGSLESTDVALNEFVQPEISISVTERVLSCTAQDLFVQECARQGLTVGWMASRSSRRF